MLKLTIPPSEFFDGRSEFIYTKEQTLQLEHSLVSLSKWEAKWKKPFLSNAARTVAESQDYVRCMTLTQNVDPNVYRAVTPELLRQVRYYIDDPMTATTISDTGKSGDSEIVTAEIIYYWMISYGIPFECQKWHLNRLLTLIRVCGVKGQKPQKIPQAELMARNRALNAKRKRAWRTKG